ncbi:MAG TPA: sugar phosphate nucleotidyltransferase [Candidatus Paceibacterota bacterium]|nr:sugar phosphate nucleotidyltransferase [Candidatus Paceibacterota bacterium]
MQAVILAAGEGTRMRPLTLTTPKPLITVAGMPILEHVVRALPDEVDEIIVVVKYLQEQIRAYCGDNFCGKRVVYVEQGEKKGTAAALEYARPRLGERFMITFADDLLAKKDLEELLTHEYSWLVAHSDTPERFGVVSLNQDGTLRTIIEKPEHPETNLISTGVGVVTQKIFEYAPSNHGEETGIPGMITALAKTTPVHVVKASFWQPVGYPEHIAEAERALEAFI